jgi:hypothetical protein
LFVFRSKSSFFGAGKEIAVSLALYRVEFFGGPFDGHVRRVWTMPQDLQPFVSLCSSPTVSNGAFGQRNRSPFQLATVAHYELVNHEGTWRYRYLGSSQTRMQRQPGLWVRFYARLKALGREARQALPRFQGSTTQISNAAS